MHEINILGLLWIWESISFLVKREDKFGFVFPWIHVLMAEVKYRILTVTPSLLTSLSLIWMHFLVNKQSHIFNLVWYFSIFFFPITFMLIWKYSRVVSLHNGGNKLNLINIIKIPIWHKSLTKLLHIYIFLILPGGKVFKHLWSLNLNVVIK